MESKAAPFVAIPWAVLGACVAAMFAHAAHAHEPAGATGLSGGAHHHQGQPDPNNGQDDRAPPELLNLGPHAFPVSTRNKLAQQFMNQGLNLSYAFNHGEAGRAFREAARLDPSLAMAYWGQALVLGPNINAPMEPKDEMPALQLVRKATSLSATASPREQALISALEKRYSGNADRRKANDKDYAEAMREAHHRFPADPDIAMLYVESMMDLNSWGYWMRDGYPMRGTAEIVATTEEVIHRHPRHPAALHMYIHLVEATATPERAEKAADTLLTLMPAAGHIKHMPSHIYMRVGRYEDAIKSNQEAVAADEAYLAQKRPQGLYPIVYFPHNIHFLWAAATAEGQGRLAIESARKVASTVDDRTLAELPPTAVFRVVPYWALARFGKWNEILQEPSPSGGNAFVSGSWHYTRGLAYAATRQLQKAEQELEALRRIMKDAPLDHPLMSVNAARSVLSIGPEVLAGEIAAARGQSDAAISHLERAVRLEDALAYTEPPEWQSPPRLTLGAILLESGRPAEAETVYWEDLRRNRNTGWALYGLWQALRAQDKKDQAELIEARLKEAWARSDVKLNASRFGCIAAPPAP